MSRKIFDKVLDVKGDQKRSLNWYRGKVKELVRGANPPEVMDGKTRKRPSVGQMNFFIYDPKYKEELPYYDRFPLIFPIEFYDNGFLGINFHYLPLPVRARLLDKLTDFASNDKFDETTRFTGLNWKALSRIPEVKPCVKRYLTSHVRSPFRVLTGEEVPIAIFLPVSRFAKKGASYVHGQSMRMI